MFPKTVPVLPFCDFQRESKGNTTKNCGGGSPKERHTYIASAREQHPLILPEPTMVLWFGGLG